MTKFNECLIVAIIIQGCFIFNLKAQNLEKTIINKSITKAEGSIGKNTEELSGEWIWVIKRDIVNRVYIFKDGTCIALNVNVRGKWSKIKDEKTIEFFWDNGFKDKMQSSESSLVLVGKNTTNDEIIAAKAP